MKNIMKKIKQYTKRYFDWVIKYRFKGFLSILSFILLIVLINFIATPRLSKNDIQGVDPGYASEIIEEIELVNHLGLPLGETLVYSNDELEMYLNTETANVRIHDPETGISWNTTYNSTRDFDNLEVYEIEAMSLMNVTYFGYDNSSESWNVFENSVMNYAFKANLIENGIQLVFDVQDIKSVNLFEYIPQEISKERFESVFLDGIENSDLPTIDKNGIITSLEFCYRYNEDKDNYYYRLQTTPQLAMIDYLILAVETLNYTQEDLVQDNSDYGIDTFFEEKPHFEVTMELTLDEEDLIVNVPTGAIKNLSDYFDIVSIDVLPNFGGADYRYKDGYTFVPDGSGAIMNLDSYQEAYPKYSKPVYDNNLYFDIYNDKEYSEDIHMPVFGMTYKRGGTSPMQGFFGIIENGKELAYINSQVSDGYTMNQSFSSFDTIQDTYLKVFGPYAVQGNLFRSESMFHNFNYQVRYKLLQEDQSTYFEMSQIYKQYLMETLELDTITSSQKLHLDVLGSVTVQDRIAGIPYDRLSTFTTVGQLEEILLDIDDNITVKYLGALNGGVKNDLMNKVDVSKGIEEDMDLNKLLEQSYSIYLDTYLTRSYSNKHGMRDQYAIHDFYGEPLSITQYNSATKQFEDDIVTTSYQVVSPRYLEDLVSKYLKQSSGLINNVSISDLGSEYYVDYNRRNFVSALDSSLLTHRVLSQINDSQNIIMDDPFIDYIGYNEFITDVSRESSNYGGFTSTVPFKQLVFNGITTFTTENMNHNTSLSNDYYLLQYVEVGAIPKFFISYDNTVGLKLTEYNYYYSIEYNTYKDDIEHALSFVDSIDTLIQDRTIVGHEIIGDQIFKTTYQSGEIVYVNYNDFDVTIQLEDLTEITIDPFGYNIQ